MTATIAHAAARPRLLRAALPMYRMPEVAADVDTFWQVVRAHLADRGVRDAPAVLEVPEDLHASWSDPGLLLSQSCGYPLVAALAGSVAVVGTFASRDVAPEGRYRSRIVITRAAHDRFRNRSWAELTAAVNDPWSLSGWVSLLAATTGAGSWPGRLVWTGSHVAALRALQDGRADIASIDAISWTLLARHRPAAVRDLEVVGEGPLVPCLPLVSAAGEASRVATLRESIIAACDDPRARCALDRQLIDHFVPLDAVDYACVAQLVAELSLVRPPQPRAW